MKIKVRWKTASSIIGLVLCFVVANVALATTEIARSLATVVDAVEATAGTRCVGILIEDRPVEVYELAVDERLVDEHVELDPLRQIRVRHGSAVESRDRKVSHPVRVLLTHYMLLVR